MRFGRGGGGEWGGHKHTHVSLKHFPQISFGDSSAASRNFRKISDDAPLMQASFQHIFLFFQEVGGGGWRISSDFFQRIMFSLLVGTEASRSAKAEAAPPLARRKRAYSAGQGGPWIA